MRTVLLCRDGADQRHLASALAAAGRLDAVVVERRDDARKRKLAKALRRGPRLLLPVRVIDVAAVVMYGNWSERVLARGLGVAGYPEGVPCVYVGNANEPASIAALRELAPEVLIVLGTSILCEEVLGVPSRHALSIHGGFLPDYRNTYSDFWALVNDDWSRVGSVIFHLDPGIDTGDIALAESIPLTPDLTFGDLKVANARLRAKLACRALELAEAGALPRVPQPGVGGRSWYAPTALQLVRGLWHIRRSRRGQRTDAAAASADVSL
ncbi:MAG TPA: formyltransferase family protein [Gaiellaceae bacterium]|nr:formyltransferase family protein [Gaiellaceae bacterium]